ncbi:MAG TPA: hypothetical protein VGZ22_16585 [Isosphaeraceae bacterium]|nr:hypothetical protein [Isosphaeraceae bacterium]
MANIELAPVVACRGCGRERVVGPNAFEDGKLSSCPVCATEDLYIQKDFPQGLGLGIVVVGFAISTLFWFFYMPISATATLMATAALDLILYYLVRDVTICYRCLSQYRGDGANHADRFHPFDLAIGERYRQERLRVEDLRQQRDLQTGQADGVTIEAHEGPR